MKVWLNMIFYQATWLTCVVGAGRGSWWPGLLVLAVFASWQLIVSPWPRADACLAVIVSVIGFMLDSTFAHYGAMRFETVVPWAGFAPIWMVALWTSFALTLNHSLAFLQRRMLLAALLGAIGAPLAYWAASRGWHALTFPDDPLVVIATTAVAWAVLMPGLARLALKLRALDVASRYTIASVKP